MAALRVILEHALHLAALLPPYPSDCVPSLASLKGIWRVKTEIIFPNSDIVLLRRDLYIGEYIGEELYTFFHPSTLRLSIFIFRTA
jgi:hypothetical protein